MIRRVLFTAALLTVSAPTDYLVGQAPGFSTGSWKRVETERFVFLYPEELSDWTHSIAGRMEAAFDAVNNLAGYTPEDRVTVIVDDPANVANGVMYAGPLLYLWPTPPSPRSLSGENLGWPEILAVHELSHAAHLTRPSRNTLLKFLTSLVPVPVTDMMRVAPRWLREGYATYIEGRVTGSGRPHGVWRPAVLRTWALEGQLPTYEAMNASSSYFGGSMAYLMGSAFLEWLVAREGGNEEVLINLSRRMTARKRRDLSQAFAGVFGAPPSELYGLFRITVTDNALAVRDALDEAGGVNDGTLFQRLTWTTGEPAVSPDGKHLAVSLRSRTRPSRLVVMSTIPDTLAAEQLQRQVDIYEADPEDVEPVSRRPGPQRALATLRAANGRGYAKPAFLPNGEGILVVRSDLVENSRSRPDLFLWEWKTGEVRRITRGAAIRDASPAPDGSWAVGTRCRDGSCDIVRIDLSTGAVGTLAQADIRRPYYHPRVSPDGRTIVASVQHAGQWRLVRMDADGSNERFIGPEDGASRFDAEFMNAGDGLVLTSTVGGIHNLELLNLRTDQAQPLTRVVSAAVAPTPTPDGEVFFLTLHSRGWDLRRITASNAPAASVVHTDPALSPAAAAPSDSAASLSESAVGGTRGYGLGPRYVAPLPLIDASVQGWSAGLTLRSTDPIGRLSWQLRGMYGSDGGWRGGGADLLWRGIRPWIRLQGFFDGDYYGGVASLETRQLNLGSAHRFKAGGSLGRLDSIQNRFLGFAEYGLDLLQTRGITRFGQSLGLHFSGGRTGDLNWARWSLSASVSTRLSKLGLGVTGQIVGTNAPASSDEELTVGGTDPTLFDPAITTHRLSMPALQVGTLQGDQLRILRADLHAAFPFPFTAFVWTGDAVDDGRGWYWTAGIEVDESLPEMPYLRLPGVRARFGAARMFSEPDNGEWHAWARLSYRP